MAQLRAQQNDLAKRLQALEQQQQPAPAPLGGGFKIEPFGGNPREDVRRWLHRFKLLRTANSWPEEKARAALALSLTGAAESWLNAQAPDAVDTVAHLAAAFRATFAPVDDSLALRDLLMSRRQGPAESVEAYAASVLETCKRLDAQMTARERCAYLLHDGFNAEIKAHLLTSMPGADNVANLLQAARTREHALLATRLTPAIHAATHERHKARAQEHFSLATDQGQAFGRRSKGSKQCPGGRDIRRLTGDRQTGQAERGRDSEATRGGPTQERQ
jgi:hypothetical protein